MKRKEVEDVMGGKDAWANVDKTDGMFLSLILCEKHKGVGSLVRWRCFG